jgi:hypothetical protein
MNPLDFFLDHRVRVFPVQHGSKKPAVPAGTNWMDWDDFVRPRPDRPYGVVLGSLIVVYGDSPASIEWISTHAPYTPFRVQSGPCHGGAPGRGVHFYFRAPQSPTPAFIRRDGLTIEARRAGQYVVGPGSLHPTGCIYKVSHEWAWRCEDLPVFPSDFVFEDGSVRPITIDGAPYEIPETVVAGERTAELFRFLRSCKAKRMDPDMARSAVQLFNDTRCEPPKSEAWIRAWFGRAWNQADRPDFGQPYFETLPVVDPAPPSFDFTPGDSDGE